MRLISKVVIFGKFFTRLKNFEESSMWGVDNRQRFATPQECDKAFLSSRLDETKYLSLECLTFLAEGESEKEYPIEISDLYRPLLLSTKNYERFFTF